MARNVSLLEASALADTKPKSAEETSMRAMQQGPCSTAIPANQVQDSSTLWPALMTEYELIHFLRIPEISIAGNHRHVIENLKRKHGLPRIYLCGKTLYLTDSVTQWLQRRVTCGN